MDLQRRKAIILALQANRRFGRKCWVKKWLRKRNKYLHLYLLKEVTVEEDYKNYFRINEEIYNIQELNKKDTVMRCSLSFTERLALTLRYLATGRNFEELKFSAMISPAAISAAIVKTCEVLMSSLSSATFFLCLFL